MTGESAQCSASTRVSPALAEGASAGSSTGGSSESDELDIVSFYRPRAAKKKAQGRMKRIQENAPSAATLRVKSKSTTRPPPRQRQRSPCAPSPPDVGPPPSKRARSHSPDQQPPGPTIELLQAELTDAQRRIGELQQRLQAADERAADGARTAEDAIGAFETRFEHEWEGLKQSAESLKAAEVEMCKLRDALATEAASRAEEAQRAKVVERELRQSVATYEIADGRKKLGQLAEKIELEENPSRKFDLEEEKLKLSRRVRDLTDEAREKFGWVAGQ